MRVSSTSGLRVPHFRWRRSETARARQLPDNMRLRHAHQSSQRGLGQLGQLHLDAYLYLSKPPHGGPARLLEPFGSYCASGRSPQLGYRSEIYRER